METPIFDNIFSHFSSLIFWIHDIGKNNKRQCLGHSEFRVNVAIKILGIR